MDGILMRKAINTVVVCLIITAFFWSGTLISDRQRLKKELIRLHVVANSDSEEDQARKLLVRDAIIGSLQMDMQKILDAEQANEYLQEKLPAIQMLAEKTLRTLGCTDMVSVSLCREIFDTRVYDTFTLPAGVYNALRIVIGEGQGKNWWCVVFPSLCVPASQESFKNVAAGAGFPETLNHTLTGEIGYDLRFGILDAMGRLENILFAG